MSWIRHDQAQVNLGRAVSSVVLVTARSSRNFAASEPDSLFLSERDGLVSHNFLREHALTIDFSSMTMVFTGQASWRREAAVPARWAGLERARRRFSAGL